MKRNIFIIFLYAFLCFSCKNVTDVEQDTYSIIEACVEKYISYNDPQFLEGRQPETIVYPKDIKKATGIQQSLLARLNPGTYTTDNYRIINVTLDVFTL